MEADEFRKLAAEYPLLIRMNDGREYLLEKPEFAIVGDYTAGILYRDNGRLLNGVISLLNIAVVLTRHETAGA
jgi:hypothetical protein